MKVAAKTRRNSKLVALFAVLVGTFLIVGSVTAIAAPGRDRNAEDKDANAGCGNSDGVDEANGCTKKDKTKDPVVVEDVTVTCTAPQVLNEAGDACITPSGGGGGDTLTCTAPQVLNEAGDACITPSGGGGGDTLTCTAPQVLNEAGDACITPSGGGSIETGGDDVLGGTIENGGTTTAPGGGTDTGTDNTGTDTGTENTGGSAPNNGGNFTDGGGPGGSVVLPPDPIDNDDITDGPFTGPARDDLNDDGGTPQADSLPGQLLPSAEAQPGQPAAGVLPFTGSDPMPVLVVGLWLIGVGGVVLLASGRLAKK